MSTKSLILSFAGAALAISTTPAMAKTSDSTSPARKADSQVYCVKFEPNLGSRIARTECKTKKAWLREGVDIEQEAGQATA